MSSIDKQFAFVGACLAGLFLGANGVATIVTRNAAWLLLALAALAAAGLLFVLIGVLEALAKRLFPGGHP